MQSLSSSYSSVSPRKAVQPDFLRMKSRKRLDRFGGRYPSASLNSNGVAVVVYNSAMGNSMWYGVGRMDEVREEIFWAPRHHFDYGVSPSVAVKDSGLVVEVHRSQWKRELLCRLGKVNGDFIKWTKCRTYTNGIDASIAVNNSDAVVEAHVSNGGHISYMVGEISSKSIKWSAPNALETGAKPSMAINDSNTVVMVYQSNSHCRQMCQVGIINKMSIYWGNCFEYGSGLNGSVSLTATSQLLIMRQGRWLDELLYGVAKVSSQKREIIEECNREVCRYQKLIEHTIRTPSTDTPLDTYWHPSVSMNDQGKVLAVYASDSSQGRAVWYQVGNLTIMGTEDTEDPPDYTGSDDEQYLSTPPDD